MQQQHSPLQRSLQGQTVLVTGGTNDPKQAAHAIAQTVAAVSSMN